MYKIMTGQISREFDGVKVREGVRGGKSEASKQLERDRELEIEIEFERGCV